MNLVSSAQPIGGAHDGPLAIYLNDHRAGAEGAQALAERCARANAGNPVEAYLTQQFLPQLRDERRQLESLRRQLGVRGNPFKQVTARVAEFVGRAKLNGALGGPTNLGRVLELEALICGVSGKRQLWRSLAARAGDDGFDALMVQADDQIDQLVALHRWAADEAFPDMSSPAPGDADAAG